MIRNALSCFVLGFGYLFSSVDDPNTGWSYIQSSNQTFYIFIDDINITDENGVSIQGYGDGTNPSTSSSSDCVQDPSECDVLGAFITHDIDPETCSSSEVNGVFSNGLCEVCVGWIYYNSYIENESNGSISTTLLVSGKDTSASGDYDYYADNGDIPFLKFYDASEAKMYDLSSNIPLGPYFNLSIYVYYSDCSDSPSGDCQELFLSGSINQDLNNDGTQLIPSSFDIVGIYPNPFNPSTTISYSIDKIEEINIAAYDTLGNEMEVLYSGIQDVGNHNIVWSPNSDVSSGTYFIKLSTPKNQLISKVTYIK